MALSVQEALRASTLAAGAAAFVGKYAGPDALLATLQHVAARRVGTT